MATSGSVLSSPVLENTHGHSFSKKTFHKPTYCHHCTDMLWGLIQQGYTCEVCNFVVHDRCLKTVVSPCTSIAATLIRNPVAHCWSEPAHFKRKFCNICRKRLEDLWGLRCEICDYYTHVECQDFAVANCKECSTYVPGKELGSVRHTHHWREGNLPPNSKCAVCKKTCWSVECLAGFRCEWCGLTAHAICHKSIPPECNFGNMQPILLPPHAVSIPRTEVPMETIIGVQTRRKEALSREYSCPRSISEEFSSGDNRFRECEESAAHMKEKTAKEKEDKDEEMIKVFDGNNSLRRRIFRTITISRQAGTQQILLAALRAFHITKDPATYFLTDAYASGDAIELIDPNPLAMLRRKDEKRPAVFLRFRDKENPKGTIKVYPGRIRVQVPNIQVVVTEESTVFDVIEEGVNAFGCENPDPLDYRLTEVLLDKGVSERLLLVEEKPWELMKQHGRDSIRQMELARFYLRPNLDPHGPTVALFVGSLPPNLNQRQYENLLMDFLGKENKYSCIGPIYYEYGSMVLTYEDSAQAVQAFYTLRESIYEEKNLLVMMLPNIIPEMTPGGVQPLLVFVNVKSGGCQGLELISSFRKLLNPYQVFDLENGGPLPGLYVFRYIKDYRIMVCGGDGTIGWVLQCLDNVGQDSECSSPPCAIVPLGTGNDLARVLRWGPGYTGGEDPINILRDVIEAEEIRLDRWTVVFHPEEKAEKDEKGALSNSNTGSTSEDNTQIFVMNNYFGIGIDADLCLDFHNAREENPNKFNSRLHNKGVYVKMGLRKMVSRKMCKDLHKEIRLEVDGKIVDLPPVEGIIILNILNWGSGANPWGPEKEDQFSKPNHWDGMLEVVGVTGVVHLGQIQSGLRSAMRIAQGGHIKIRMNTELPVQVDGEPWIQNQGEVVVLKSALKSWQKIPKIDYSRVCTACHLVFGLALEYVSKGATESEVQTLVAGLCLSLLSYSAEMCRGIASEYIPDLYYIITHSNVTAEIACTIALQQFGCSTYQPELEWNVTVNVGPKPPVQPVFLPPVNSESLKVLHFSDIHFDSEYSEGSNSNCQDVLCCRSNDRNPANETYVAGPWGTTYGKCDIPYQTLVNAIEYASETFPDIDYIILTGDLPAHNLWSTTREGNEDILTNVTTLFKSFFPNTPVFPTLGNHESSPANEYPLQEIINPRFNPSWLYNTAADAWSSWLSNETLTSVRYAGYYSTLVKPGFRMISLNTNFGYTNNFWLLYDSVDPEHMLSWLAEELLAAEAAGEKVHIIGHMPPGNFDCWHVWNREFAKLIDRFENTIAAQFYGHTHKEEYKVVYDLVDTNRAVSVAYIGGSITTYTGLNPGFRVYSIDGARDDNSTYTVLDFDTWVYNITEANEVGTPQWYKLYSAMEEYGMESLQPQEWSNLAFRMYENSTLYDIYYRNYVKDGDGAMSEGCPVDSDCQKRILCEAVTGNTDDMSQCKELLNLP